MTQSYESNAEIYVVQDTALDTEEALSWLRPRPWPSEQLKQKQLYKQVFLLQR